MKKYNRIKVTLNKNNTIQSSDAFLVEYQAAQDFALHSDSIAWQIGSVFIGGILILLGILLQEYERMNSFSFHFGLLFAVFALSIWYIFAQGQYQLMQMKLFRVREIENMYGLKQNSGWEKKADNNYLSEYRIYGMGGRILKNVLYIFFSIFIVFLGIINTDTILINPPSIDWTAVVIEFFCVCISLGTYLYCYHNEKLFRNYINCLSKNAD